MTAIERECHRDGALAIRGTIRPGGCHDTLDPPDPAWPRSCRRHRLGGRPPARAARRADDAEQMRATLGARAGAAVARRRRAQGDDADARRRPAGDRHLPSEECHRQGADRLREDAVQLQLLGRPQRRAIRHDRGADRDQARLRLRRPERARTLLLRRELRHPRAAGDRRLRRDGLAREAGMVERQGRRDRLLVDRGVSAGGRGAGTSRRSRR